MNQPMLRTLWLELAPLSLALASVFPVEQDDHAAAIERAGADVTKLTQLAEAWDAAGEEEAARAAYTRLVELDESNVAAHEALGHHTYGGKWFSTYAELSAYRRAEAKRMLADEGKMPFRDRWVPVADVPYLRMGWVQDESQQWVHPAKREMAAAAAKYREEGWQQQDLTWVRPDEFDKWREGLYKVGEEWMSEADANTHHAQLGQWWEIPGERFIALTTVNRTSARWITWWADHTYADLVRIFGVQPASKPEFLTVNGIDQYNTFAAGDPATGVQGSENSGYSSVHFAYFADSFVDQSIQPVAFRGMGVCYWATADENLKNYGQQAVRHAAAHSYMEAIDPSWDFISRVVTGAAQPSADGFWREKKIPLWMRYGSASYVERFFKDDTVDETQGGNPWWARAWAFENLRANGGPRRIAGETVDFETIFAFPLDPNNPGDGSQLITEAGLIMSFVLDGECDAVIAAHQAFKAALRSGDGTDEELTGLRDAIIANEKALLRYANL